MEIIRRNCYPLLENFSDEKLCFLFIENFDSKVIILIFVIN